MKRVKLTQKTQMLMGNSVKGATGLSILDMYDYAQSAADKAADMMKGVEKYIANIKTYVQTAQDDPQYPIISTSYNNALAETHGDYEDMMKDYSKMILFINIFGVNLQE